MSPEILLQFGYSPYYVLEPWSPEHYVNNMAASWLEI